MPPRRQVKARTPELAALGKAIRQTREKAGLTQEQLADLAETDTTQIGGLERGTRNPSYTTLFRVATALKTEVGTLATLADRLRARYGRS
jgi:transcriptional regulator with XRE-family HTH domain